MWLCSSIWAGTEKSQAFYPWRCPLQLSWMRLKIFTPSSLKKSYKIFTRGKIIQLWPVWLQSCSETKHNQAQIVKARRNKIRMPSLRKNIQHKRHFAQTQPDKAYQTRQTEMPSLRMELLGAGKSQCTHQKKTWQGEILLWSLWEDYQYFWQEETFEIAQETRPAKNTARSRWCFTLWSVRLQSTKASLLQ